MPVGVNGLGAAPVRELRAGTVRAWVSTVNPEGGSKPTLAELRAHDAVTAAALAVGTPVPVRFGQRFVDDAACVAALAPRGHALAALLREVDAAVEMRILLAAPADLEAEPVAGGPGGRGRAYLEGVRARVHGERALEARAERLRGALASLPGVRRDATSVRTAPPASITVAHLVERSALDAHRQALVDVLADGGAASLGGEGRGAGFQLVVTGPHAPWSFAVLPDA